MIAVQHRTSQGCIQPTYFPKIVPFNLNTVKTPENSKLLRPFLRWVGGKQKLVPALLDFMPSGFKGRYFEPFLGGGSLFLAHGSKRAELSDVNPHLINAYKMVRDVPDQLHYLIGQHSDALKTGGAEYYYHQREEFREAHLEFDAEQAARFIFLNHANHKGMYRVNQMGQYNVPYGHNHLAGMPKLEHLKAVSERLSRSGVTLAHRGYDSILELVRRGDFVYLDPPYPKLSRTANFTEYSILPFSEQEQHMLAEFAKILDKRGVHVMISIADVPLIRQFYYHWHIHSTQLRRNVNSKSVPFYATELIITNYPS